MIAPGTAIPHFSVPSDAGGIVTQESLKGTWSIIYFYPKDDTPGCTTEACSIRDALPDFEKRGVVVYGVSKDTTRSHGKFRGKYELNFPLLSDQDHQMAEAFGIWVEKTLYGRKYMGMERSTFVINPDGVVVAAFPKVNPVDHGQFLLKELDAVM